MTKQRNVAREIILSLVAAVVFASGLYTYIKSSITEKEFRARCAASEFLARVERVALSRTRRTVPPGISANRTSLQGNGALVSAQGSIEVTFTFVSEAPDELKILVLALAGIPILDGVSGKP